MEFNRDHYFTIGLILLALGAQLRYVDSYQLTEPATRFLAEKFHQKPAVAQTPLTAFFGTPPPIMPKKTVRPPDWIGWALLSVGAVLVLQALGMRRPGS